MPAIAWLFFGALFCFSNIYFYIFKLVYLGRDNEVKTESSSFPIVCYFGMGGEWPDNGTLHPALNATLCTHILFIATTINSSQIALASPSDASKYFNKVPLLRKINPSLKLFVTNGGGNNNMFSQVLASAENRTRFTKSLIPFIRKYDLDGLDIDWEFPGFPPNPPTQTANFTMLLQEIHDAFNSEALHSSQTRLQLSLAVGAAPTVIWTYDIPKLHSIVDFINLMCYDFRYYAVYDPITGYNAPLYPKTWREKPVFLSGNTAWAAYKWHEKGMPKEKIMVGIPTYAHTWTLMFPGKYHGLDAPATGPGPDGDEEPYVYVCDKIANGSTVVYDEDAAVPYAYNGSLWISYDNERSVYEKTKWIIENSFGGIMIFTLNDDDYMGHCDGNTKFPLISNISSTVHNMTRRR